MEILLVRHGHAGTKEGWAGDDRLRPLDARGRRQAEHLVGIVVPMHPTRLLSSPHARCLQTMEPVAAKTGLVIEEEGALTPDAPQRALELVRSLSAPPSPAELSPAELSSSELSPVEPAPVEPAARIALCTHGEVIGDVLAALAKQDGVRLSRRPPGLKGCVWVLDFRKGKVDTARYIAPGR
jgi:broad specificity phosphatase PhoE